MKTHFSVRLALRCVLITLATTLVITACGVNEGQPSNVWTWVDGSKMVNQTGTYGTEDFADAANVPGARQTVMSWTDTSGKLWLFGGIGLDSAGVSGALNDLWMFDPATQMWTWVDGNNIVNQPGIYGVEDIADIANVPGGRQSAMSWTDAGGKLWLFGGNGYDSTGTLGDLNDLWMFDPATQQWTWVDGSNIVNQPGTYGVEDTAAVTNVPGARQRAMRWIDAGGRLWLFGGYGYDSTGTLGYLNDLWQFDPATQQWTWVDGSTLVNQFGTYGVEDTAAIANVPGARVIAAGWIDAGGKLWLFGGSGTYDITGTVGYFNDLWKFDPATQMWTWVDGNNAPWQMGVYGTEGKPDAANVPGGRTSTTSWIDAGGNLWLFGGLGMDTARPGPYNDLWMFDPATQQWTWVDGSNTPWQTGVYGTEDMPNATNVPGARVIAAGWTDAGGNLWLFGGYGHDGAAGYGALNDLWRYTP